MSQRKNKKPTFADILKKSDEIAFPFIGIDVANIKDCNTLTPNEPIRDMNILNNIKEVRKRFDKKWSNQFELKTSEEYEKEKNDKLFNKLPHDDDVNTKTFVTGNYGKVEVRESQVMPKNTILFVGSGAKFQITNMFEFPEEYRKYVGIIKLLTGWKRFWYKVKMFFIKIKWAIERFNKYIKEDIYHE